MKAFKSTWIFGLLVVALGVYVIWDFTELKRADDLSEGEVRLTGGFAPEKVKVLEIEKGGNKLRAEITSDRCDLVVPVKDLCDEGAVYSLLSNLSSLRAQEVKEVGDSSNYGFDDAAATKISWTLDDGTQKSVVIGSQNTFDGGFYISSESKVYVSDKMTGQLTNKNFSILRDHKVWRGPEELKSLSVRGPESKFSLKQDQDSWVFEDKKEDLKPSLVKEWISSLKNLKATEVLDQFKTSDRPDWTFEINGGEYDIQFFSSREQFYVRESGSERVLIVPGQRLKKLLVGKSYFYDPNKPFKFSLERVSWVDVLKGKESFKFVKEGQEWKMPSGKVTEAQLTQFFQRLLSFKARSFEGLQNHLNFKPHGHVSLKSSSEETLLQFEWGQEYKEIKGPFAGESLIVIKVSGIQNKLGVSKSDLEQLLSPFFPAKHIEEEGSHGHHHH